MKKSVEYVKGFRLGMKVGKNSDAEFVRGFNAGRKTAAMLALVSKPGPKAAPAKRAKRQASAPAGA